MDEKVSHARLLNKEVPCDISEEVSQGIPEEMTYNSSEKGVFNQMPVAGLMAGNGH